jgi:hypothetical protein
MNPEERKARKVRSTSPRQPRIKETIGMVRRQTILSFVIFETVKWVDTP